MASKSRICSLDRLAVGKNTLCMNAYYAAVWLEAPRVFYPSFNSVITAALAIEG